MKYIYGLAITVTVLVGFYFYNALDNIVTDSCQAGVITARHLLKHRGSIDAAFYKCAANTVGVKSDIYTAESGCAYGIGVGLDYFDHNREWDYYKELMQNKPLTLDLMSYCLSKYRARHN